MCRGDIDGRIVSPWDRRRGSRMDGDGENLDAEAARSVETILKAKDALAKGEHLSIQGGILGDQDPKYEALLRQDDELIAYVPNNMNIIHM